jgi:hydroxysqualene dehydroxylase
VDHRAPRLHLMPRTVHVVGAGVAGLAAAVRLASRGANVAVHEAAGQAGGRCRSYHDPALDMVIDNGNHLLLSANHAALAYLAAIGAEGKLAGPPAAEFAFVDLAGGERWTLRINAGPLPWWIFDPRRRVPGTRAIDYFSLARLLYASDERTICETVACAGPVYDRLARPLFVAALNTEPKEASAGLAGAIIRETLAKGGKACRPLIARDGLGPVFIEPALRFLAGRGVMLNFGRRLRALDLAQGNVVALDFAEDQVALGADDRVILAVPPVVAADLVPGLTTPSEFRAIVNAHFRLAPPAGLAPIIGVVNGTVEWLFAFPDRLSVTISAADRLLDVPRETLVRQIWDEVATIAGLPNALPPWQIVRERRATFAATPAESAKRPGPQTAWRNLFLAGDWTQTGLPATIEGAIRSGNRAADLVSDRGM